jgi:hypothetical protein
MGDPCKHACEIGQTCVEYFDIAGEKQQNCEIVCGPQPERLCPAGFLCTDIADGPQNVCY